ncbi:hypothetical protein BZG36_01573 [Bifiguratus adelaidae]|uniref:Sensor domain-containing protein n=1 Tax=Bifiguratus adelaidae TaxID=1938954 RepID=A0A261Y3Z1_9FUNG|nr:hypothetical protein BZG36_01573 [Bifiguratus adelaidae]
MNQNYDLQELNHLHNVEAPPSYEYVEATSRQPDHAAPIESAPPSDHKAVRYLDADATPSAPPADVSLYNPYLHTTADYISEDDEDIADGQVHLLSPEQQRESDKEQRKESWWLHWLQSKYGWRAVVYLLLPNTVFGLFAFCWCISVMATLPALLLFAPIGMPLLKFFLYSVRCLVNVQMWLYMTCLGNPFLPTDPRYRRYDFDTSLLPPITIPTRQAAELPSSGLSLARSLINIWNLCVDPYTIKAFAFFIGPNFVLSIIGLCASALGASLGATLMIFLLPLCPFLCGVFSRVQADIMRGMLGGTR